MAVAIWWSMIHSAARLEAILFPYRTGAVKVKSVPLAPLINLLESVNGVCCYQILCC
jgi:hypothetical protein